MNDKTWNCILAMGYIGIFILVAVIIGSFAASIVAGIVTVSIIGVLIVFSAIMAIWTINRNQNDAIKSRNAATEEKISSDDYKASVKKMLSKAIVEIQYSDMKSVDLEDASCLQVSDNKSAQEAPSTPAQTYTYKPAQQHSSNYSSAQYKKGNGTQAKRSYSFKVDENEDTKPYVNPVVKATEDYLQYEEIEKWSQKYFKF